jgi:O-antigen/teichoic acid export membrane protein
MPPAAMPRLLRDSTLYFVGNMAGRLLSLVMIPFYTHHLSTEEYGILALVELSTSIVAIVFGLQSIGQTLTRVYHDQDDVAERRRVVSTTLLGTALLAVCIAALAAIFAGRSRCCARVSRPWYSAPWRKWFWSISGCGRDRGFS